IADPQLPAQLAHVNRLPFVDGGRVAGDYVEVTKRREVGDDVLEVDPGFGTGRLVGAEPFPS
ncbi:MAG: hypothetical protein WB769_18180, partial [Pseudolabrys sp.]